MKKWTRVMYQPNRPLKEGCYVTASKEHQPQGFLRTGGEFIFHHSLHFLSVDRRNAYAWGRDRS